LEGEGHVVLQLAGQCAVAAAGDGEVVADVVVEGGLGLGILQDSGIKAVA